MATVRGLEWPTFISLRLLHIGQKPHQGVMLTLSHAQLQGTNRYTQHPHNTMSSYISCI